MRAWNSIMEMEGHYYKIPAEEIRNAYTDFSQGHG